MAEYLQLGDMQNPPPDAPKQEQPSPATISTATPQTDGGNSRQSTPVATPTGQNSSRSTAKVSSEAPRTVKEEAADERQGFGNSVQYLLTVIGYAVGLGNIWRFPALAYENGGGAFLVPYVICAVTFGLPIIFIELSVGQYTRRGPSVAFRDYIPLLQGLGWVMGVVSFSFTLFYNVIIGWAGLYLLTILSGGISSIVTCDNEWNLKDDCGPNSTTSAAEQFFNFNILQRTQGFDDWGVLNWKALLSNSFCWSLACLGLVFGVKWLGRLSLFTATVPYLIIGILFIRGVTLDGASEGIDYYLLRPAWERMFLLETWRMALSQICFSLSVGIGGLLAMSSYNKPNHNFFRDAIVIVVADSFMSIFGGLAVFSTLGFLAKSKGVAVSEVVKSSLALAFIAYPEAVNQMPAPYVWGFCFFFMLFLLGVSTMFGLLMGTVTCLSDQFEFCRKRHALVVGTLGVIGVSCGVLFCMGSGIYWFTVFNDFIGSLAVTIAVISELIVINFIYGSLNFFDDVKEMRGEPGSVFLRIFGSSGYVMRFLTCITAPILTVVVIVATCYHERIVYAKTYVFPLWTEYFGWTLGLLPMLMLPALAIINCLQFRRQGKPLSELLRVQPTHPSYARILAAWDQQPAGTPSVHSTINQMSSTSAVGALPA